MKRGILLLILALTALLALAASAELTLVENGTARAVIVVTPEAAQAVPTLTDAKADADTVAEKVAWAARDLQTYIEKMSGAKLPIVTDDAPGTAETRVLVGRSKLTAKYDAKIPSGLTTLREEEGYAILTGDGTLVLAGNDAEPYHGTEYAVSFFLDKLGVRWYLPGDFGEVIPRQATITVANLNEVSRPDFKMRNWWTHWMANDLRGTETRWKIHNGMNPDPMHNIPGDSSVRSVLPPEKEKDNPIYAKVFARGINGQVYPHMPNLASDESVQYAANVIKEYFRNNPNATSYGIGADDGLPRDFSPETDKYHMRFPSMIGRFNDPGGVSTTEEWMRWVHRVSAEVKKEFPDRFISTNGYANRDTPPLGLKSDPTIWIMFAAIWVDNYHALDSSKSWMTRREYNMLKDWTSQYDNVWMYNYIYNNLCGGGNPPIPLARRYMHDMPILKRLGIAGFMDEGRVVAGEAGIFPTWLRARMMWDADQDGWKLMDRFFAEWYGPAAAPAKAFWEEMETAIENSIWSGNEEHMLSLIYTPELIKRMEGQLKKAEAAAKGSPVAELHVLADRAMFNGLVAYKAMERAEANADFAEAVKQAQRILDSRKPAMAISRFYWDEAKPGKYAPGEYEGFYYWGTAMRHNENQKLADKTNGKTGELIAVLPERAKFSTDIRDEGRFDGWYKPEFDDRKWQNLLTTLPFYAQGSHLDEKGFPYMGAIWYRLDVKVPASAKGKTVKLYAFTAETEAWVWVNGKLMGHRPYIEAYIRPNAIDMDVTDALIPGKKNSIVVRLHTDYQPAQMAAGLASRLFLYAPKDAAK
ncbi:MAG: DUF4838 domain-containing protein [Armatimonadota bacterium]